VRVQDGIYTGGASGTQGSRTGAREVIPGLFLTDAALQPQAQPAQAGGDVHQVLAKGRFPWYDAKNDRVKPVLPAPDFGGGPWKTWGNWLSDLFAPLGRFFRGLNGWHVPGIGGLGDVVAVGLALLLLTVVLVALLELLRRYRRTTDEEAAARAAALSGRTARIEGLPAADRLNLADPWAEAQRLRARGDLAGAIIHLFAYQLLTLARVRKLRLVPGRTARQLIRAVTDTGLRTTVEPTLRLFEAVYYGHHAPSSAAFETVWLQVEAFERQVAAVAGGTAS
jgi:hypothetical protein